MSGTKDYDYLLKILLVGESGVGKSCLLLRFAEGTFSQSFISTIGVDFKMKKVTLNDRVVKLQVWDTAGQERYRTIVSSFYRGAHGIILTFDVTDINSFLKVRHWLSEIKKNAPDGTRVLLVGNKSDLQSKRMVDAKEAQSFAEKSGLKYMETSAKDGTNVEEVFTTLGVECLDVVVHQSQEEKKSGTIDNIDPNNPGAAKGGCC